MRRSDKGTASTAAAAASGGVLAFLLGALAGGGLALAASRRGPRGEPGLIDRLGSAALSLTAGGERQADSPAEIPPRGWWDVLKRTYAEIDNDRVLAVAAGVSFYGLLALVPAIAAFVSIYGLVADRTTIASHLALLDGLLPPAALAMVGEQVARLTANETKLGLALVIGLGLSLWSANAGVKAMIDALNVAYNEREKRGFVMLNAISLGFTFSILVFAILAIFVVGAAPIALKWLALGGATEWIMALGRWPVIFLVLLTGLALLYRFAPSRTDAQWRWVSPGALLATIVWGLYSVGFSWYVVNFGDYDAAYGSLGAVVALLIWMWLSVAIVLVGAELNCESERQTFQDTTTGAPKPIGQRGANAADVKPA